MADYSHVNQKNIEFFSNLVLNAKDEHHAVAQSPQSHLKRFEAMLQLGDFTNKSILDVGCGLGGFYEFLLSRNMKPSLYHGYDINPHMIEKAKQKNPSIAEHFKVLDIIQEDSFPTFDYIISVGPLNLKFENSMNMETTSDLLKQMFKHCQIGMALSMTSLYTEKPNDETFYFDPSLIIKDISPYCTNFKLDHTYLPHDFTIFCYRKSLYS